MSKQLEAVRKTLDEIDRLAADMAYAVTHLHEGIKREAEVSFMTKEGAKVYYDKGNSAFGEFMLKIGLLQDAFRKGSAAGDLILKADKFDTLKLATKHLIDSQFYDNGSGVRVCRGCSQSTGDGHAEGCPVGSAEDVMADF